MTVDNLTVVGLYWLCVTTAFYLGYKKNIPSNLSVLYPDEEPTILNSIAKILCSSKTLALIAKRDHSYTETILSLGIVSPLLYTCYYGSSSLANYLFPPKLNWKYLLYVATSKTVNYLMPSSPVSSIHSMCPWYLKLIFCTASSYYAGSTLGQNIT